MLPRTLLADICDVPSITGLTSVKFFELLADLSTLISALSRFPNSIHVVLFIFYRNACSLVPRSL